MKTIEEIYNTPALDKGMQFVNLAKELLTKANEVIDEERFIERKIRDEIASSFRASESADCEYTAYVNAHRAEGWFLKLMALKNGSLTASELFNA